MTWFFCSGCDMRFEAPFAYHGVACAFCRRTERVRIDQRDVGAEVLSREKALELAGLVKSLADAKHWQTHWTQRLATFKARYRDGDRATIQAKSEKHYVDTVQDLVENVEYYGSLVQTCQRRLDNFEQAWQLTEGAAQTVRLGSLNVNRSGKNKLYIGDRQFVVAHTTAKQSKTRSRKLRILDSNSWTWGLNTSWVEGGVEARAQFKLKLDDGNARKTFPEQALDWFRDHASITEGVPSPTDNAALESEFLTMCRQQGAGSLLWYDRPGEPARPTWTALEMACLMRRGYRFQFGQSKNQARKVVLMPPPVP